MILKHKLNKQKLFFTPFLVENCMAYASPWRNLEPFASCYSELIKHICECLNHQGQGKPCTF